MTKDSIGRRISTGLIEHRPCYIEELLSPLREGKPVMLRVTDPRLPKKTRKYETILVLMPMVQLGLDASAVLASMPPYGSELLDTRHDLKAARLARLGLSMKLARALADALKKVLWRTP